MADTVLDSTTQNTLNRLRKIDDIIYKSGASKPVAVVALDQDFKMNDDIKEAKAIQAAVNAYTEKSNSLEVWLKSFVGGPSNKDAAHAAAVAAVTARGAGPNDVPNLVKAAEGIAQAKK